MKDEQKHDRIFEHDPYLRRYAADIELRMERYRSKRAELLAENQTLSEFANAHEYFGFHRTRDGWVYREWAPAADALFLTGDMNAWSPDSLPMHRLKNGVFELFLEGEHALWDGCHVQTVVHHAGQELRRVPLYIRRVEQNAETGLWCGVICDTPPYRWRHRRFLPKKNLFIYECHVGMAQEEETVGTYRAFADRILPRIEALGYNTIQIMAVMEHPYYGSFGYQVSSFYAVSSRFGTPDDLKYLIDKAHGMGIAVLLDVVHSHAVRNTAEGINEFDGTATQFFHEGARGEHPTWGTKLFHYGKNEVLHFLLSNLKFWLNEYHFDGFRFDGVTSMIYLDHGLGVSFGDYGLYFSPNTDLEALTYLQLANELCREVSPHVITIAEDMSAMPGMCLPIEEGGIGFDYRLAMGLPDLWVRLVRKLRDEDWDMWQIWHELTGRRPGEKYIGYVESHDQALVGDKTLIFRLCDSAMYTDMSKNSHSPVIDRGIALCKLIRFATVMLGGEGYLNFMGNEFGHPEWIDFPREGNGWSMFYCRRQWHLADDEQLRYRDLQTFDAALIGVAKKTRIMEGVPRCIFIDDGKKVLVWERRGVIAAANFHPTESYADYWVEVPRAGEYQILLSTDRTTFGGWARINEQMRYPTHRGEDGRHWLRLYLPSRTGVCLKKVK